MIRRLDTLASAVSLVLCITAAVFWVRSYYRFDWAVFIGEDYGRAIGSSRGLLSIWMFRFKTDYVNEDRFGLHFSPPGSPIQHLASDTDPYQNTLWAKVTGWRGFGVEEMNLRKIRVTRITGDAFIAPLVGDVTGPTLFLNYWLVTGLLAVLPVGWMPRIVRRLRRLRRPRAGSCAVCGYDLRATPSRCPECGALVCKPA